MQAMILSAGYGTRLKPITNFIPKSLAPILEYPLLALTLKWLSSAGFKKIVINLCHHSEKIKKEISNITLSKTEVIFLEENPILGSAGGIANAKRYLDKKPFFTINGDILFDLNFKEVEEFHNKNKPICTLILKKDPDAVKFGLIETDSQNRIIRFLGSGTNQKAAKRLMFCGIHLMNPEIFDYLPFKSSNICRDIYPSLVKKNQTMMGYELKNYWKDIGTPESLFQANMDVLRSKAPDWIMSLIRKQHNDEFLNKPYYLGKNTTMGKGTKIEDGSIIGSNCIIGNNCTLKNCLIFPNTRIEDNANIFNCILSNDFKIQI
ncbi:MAG: NDP-sugar synthase [Candidatus Auribacterota bacterium]|nr:NDP-sugar synthase [Candidatus Auribacterota bacterium]